jgi:hypothetical protein
MDSDDYEDEWDEARYARRRRYAFDRPLPHSGLGIASCVISGCILIFCVVLFIIAGIMEASHPNIFDEEESPQVIVLGLLFILNLLASLIGLVLGIVAAALGNRNKLFAGLGIGLNSLLFLGIIVLMIIGALMG